MLLDENISAIKRLFDLYLPGGIQALPAIIDASAVGLNASKKLILSDNMLALVLTYII